MFTDRPRLTYFLGALLLSAGVLLICLLKAPSPVALLGALLSCLLFSLLPVYRGGGPASGPLLKRAALRGSLAGAGLFLALEALKQSAVSAPVSLALIPVCTAIGGMLLNKERLHTARLLCLAAVLAGLLLGAFFPGFSVHGVCAAVLLALARLTGRKADSPGGRTMLRFGILFAACSGTAVAFMLSMTFVPLPDTPFFWAGPVLLGAGYALMRSVHVPAEDGSWLRAAGLLPPLLFLPGFTGSDAALWACFLLAAGGTLFGRLPRAPGRYKTGEERQLLLDRVPISFYNGVLCLRHPFQRFTSAASFFFILFNSNRGRDRRYHANPDTVKHEYGHILQAKALGCIRYWRYIALPSTRGYMKKVPYADYYNQPWERGADALGGVTRYVHKEGSEQDWESYFLHALPRRKRARYNKKEGNTMIKFLSDYQEGACREIMDALQATNLEQSEGYGEDAHCTRARELIRAACERSDADVHFLIGGTSCNKILISAALRPFEGVLCVQTAHINVHETGTIEASGHKVLALPSPDGKLTALQIEETMAAHWADATHEHIVRPGIVYITHPTEGGLLYSLEELRAIRQACNKWGLYLYMDGARLGYGLAAEETDVTLPDIARLTDAFYIGGTKVGALFGEAMVLLAPALKKDFRYMIKNQGGLLAKGRLQGVQFETLFTDGLYRKLGEHAVHEAMRIKAALKEKGIPTLYDSPTNQQFPLLTPAQFDTLSKKYAFESWGQDQDGLKPVRFCTGWATRPEHVDALIADIRAL